MEWKVELVDWVEKPSCSILECMEDEKVKIGYCTQTRGSYLEIPSSEPKFYFGFVCPLLNSESFEQQFEDLLKGFNMSDKGDYKVFYMKLKTINNEGKLQSNLLLEKFKKTREDLFEFVFAWSPDLGIVCIDTVPPTTPETRRMGEAFRAVVDSLAE